MDIYSWYFSPRLKVYAKAIKGKRVRASRKEARGLIREMCSYMGVNKRVLRKRLLSDRGGKGA